MVMAVAPPGGVVMGIPRSRIFSFCLIYSPNYSIRPAANAPSPPTNTPIPAVAMAPEDPEVALAAAPEVALDAAELVDDSE